MLQARVDLVKRRGPRLSISTGVYGEGGAGGRLGWETAGYCPEDAHRGRWRIMAPDFDDHSAYGTCACIVANSTAADHWTGGLNRGSTPHCGSGIPYFIRACYGPTDATLQASFLPLLEQSNLLVLCLIGPQGHLMGLAQQCIRDGVH